MDAATALAAWSMAPASTVCAVAGGLINQTWRVETSGTVRGYLQRLNTDVFRPEVHEDIEAVTAHLARRGVVTPRLVRTAVGGLFHVAGDGSVWRMLTPVGDTGFTTLPSSAHAASAGRLIARVHGALADLDHRFRMVRPGAHDTAAHMAALSDAVATHRTHPLWEAVAPLAEAITMSWAGWQGARDLPARVIHGDLKVSNLRFMGDDAVALVDLDTFAVGTLDVELGDALRSWCNPAGEDEVTPTFRDDLFGAAVCGYAEGGGASAAEWEAVVPGVERIALELSARFARDALRECYFGWNPAMGTRGEHNLLRARGQFALARSVAAQRRGLVQRVDAARRRSS